MIVREGEYLYEMYTPVIIGETPFVVVDRWKIKGPITGEILETWYELESSDGITKVLKQEEVTEILTPIRAKTCYAHVFVDTGTLLSFCKVCNITAEWSRGSYEYVIKK